MAIPNLYNAISYPNIRPTTVNDTLWATVAPYEEMQRENLNRDVIRQNMALAQTGEERAQKRLELEQAQEGRAQKQEGRVEREFEEKESEWERKAGLREAVIGAAQKANGDPMQTLVNLRDVYLRSGEAGLGLEIQDLAPKLIGAIPGYEAKSQAWGLMGVQVTPDQLAAQDAKASGSADGGSVYTPGKGFEFFQSPQGAQEASMKRQELDMQQQALTQSAQRLKGDELTTGERLTLKDIEDQISDMQGKAIDRQSKLARSYQSTDGLEAEDADRAAAETMRGEQWYKLNQQRTKILLDRRNAILKRRYPDFDPAAGGVGGEPANPPSTVPSKRRRLVDGILYPGAAQQGAEPAQPVAPRGAPAPIYDPTSVPGMGLQGPSGSAPMSIQPGMSGSPYADPYAQAPGSTPIDQATLEYLAAQGIIRLR